MRRPRRWPPPRSARFGGIDLLVNNAAIYGGMQLDTLLTVDWDYYRRFMAVNMDGALVVTRACYTHMARRGGGAIVNQSSTAAWLYAGFYGLAKVGINGLTQQLAAELGGRNIRVNAIAPGPIDTEATRTVVPSEMIDDIVQGLALKRRGTPQDLVGMCLFLLSDEASWITGQIFNVDGGQIVRSIEPRRVHRAGSDRRTRGRSAGRLAGRAAGVRHAARRPPTTWSPRAPPSPRPLLTSAQPATWCR